VPADWNDRVTFPCWHCSAKLFTQNFKTLADPLGNPVKVHRDCRDEAEESLRQITAAPNEWPTVA
jgi:hypothetical protein